MKTENSSPKTEIQVLECSVELSAKLIETGVNFPNDKQGRTLHNKFRVSMRSKFGRASFLFYDSQANLSKSKLDADGLQGAFECFLSDSCAGNDTFESFCSEFGYDIDSRNAERIYRACVASFKKFAKLLPDVDIYDFTNEFNEIVNG
jgi:hypothetical protein